MCSECRQWVCPDARGARPTNGLLHERAQLLGRDGVEPGRGLVEEQQLGLEHQETGEGHPALLPEAELMTRTVQQMVYAQGRSPPSPGSTSRLDDFDTAAKADPRPNVLGHGACDEVVFRVLAEKRHASVEPGAERPHRATRGSPGGSWSLGRVRRAPASRRNKLDFPAPLGPHTRSHSPLARRSSSPSSTPLSTAFDVDGIEVDAVLSPDVFTRGAAEQCVFLGTPRGGRRRAGPSSPSSGPQAARGRRAVTPRRRRAASRLAVPTHAG